MTQNETKQIDRVRTKWRDTFVLNQTMFNGRPPRELLKVRRPLESANNYTLEYRLENYHAVQASLFKRAVQQYLEVLNKSDVQISSTSETLTKFLQEYKKYENGRYFTLKNWLFNYIAEKRQIDPNGIILVFPKVEFLDNVPIIPDTSTKSPDVKIEYIPYQNIIEINEYVLQVKLGQLIIEEKAHDYFLIVKNPQYDIKYPFKGKDTVEYTQVPFQLHAMKTIPFTHIGGSLLTETIENKDGECQGTFDYYVSDFFGAVYFACYMITSLSDKQVNVARHNFPIKYAVKRKCDITHSSCSTTGVHMSYNGGESEAPCNGCGGTGWKKDTDTFGTLELDPGNTLDGTNIDLKSPVGYVTPPIESLKFLHDDFNDYYLKTAQELCVNVKQNLTNQSAESKSYDVQNKVSQITYIVEDVLRTTVDVYGFVEKLLENKAEANIDVKKPASWDIKTKEDVQTQLTDAKKNGAPHFTIQQLSEELLYKELDDLRLGNWVAALLIKKDKLFTYNTAEYNDAIVKRGAEITPQMKVIHENGLSILKEITTRQIEINDIATLERLFDAEINQVPTPATGL